MSTELAERIRALKQAKNAIILAHNYQIGEVQEVADFVGDSLQLSRKAAEVEEADVIVFCGVHFMAETAAILSPDKTVLLPAPDAGCPMADMVTAEELRARKAEFPDAKVVCYVNSTAAVKAESDCCCTSANAVDVVDSFPESTRILFVPDQYLGDYVREHTGRDLILWPGYCPSHARIMDFHVAEARKKHREALVLAHPECTPAVRHAADEVLSTGGMIRFVQSSPAEEFIIATEIGMLYRLRRDNPGKRFYQATEQCVCPNMKRIRLERVLWALESMQHPIRVPESIRVKARQAIDRMLAIPASGRRFPPCP